MDNINAKGGDGRPFDPRKDFTPEEAYEAFLNQVSDLREIVEEFLSPLDEGSDANYTLDGIEELASIFWKGRE